MIDERHQVGILTMPAAKGARRVQGFTLLEVLVALLVLSVGLLGLAGLQTYSLRNNTSALQRSQATVLAYDILDRMRGNRDQATLGAGSKYKTNFGPPPTTYPNCGAGVCTSANTALYEIARWKADIARLLGGQGQITIDASNKVTIEIQWSDNRDNSNLLNLVVETLI